MIQGLFIGLGISAVFCIPLIVWAKKMGKVVYANSRIRGMSKKLFSEKELTLLKEQNTIQKIQKSDYWQLLQFSHSRKEYEKKLEEYFDQKLKKVNNLSSEEIKKYLEKYYKLRKELDDLKLIFYCLDNNRNKEEVQSLLKTKKYEDILKYNGVLDAVSQISFLNFSTYNKFGIIGIEYSIDNYFFKQIKKFKLYSIIRKDYLIKQIIRLKEMKIKDSIIIELLDCTKKESELVKKDLNILIKEISEKNKEIRTMILQGQETQDVLDYYFDNNLFNHIKKEKRKQTFSDLASFYLIKRYYREITAMKKLWSIR